MLGSPYHLGDMSDLSISGYPIKSEFNDQKINPSSEPEGFSSSPSLIDMTNDADSLASRRGEEMDDESGSDFDGEVLNLSSPQHYPVNIKQRPTIMDHRQRPGTTKARKRPIPSFHAPSPSSQNQQRGHQLPLTNVFQRDRPRRSGTGQVDYRIRTIDEQEEAELEASIEAAAVPPARDEKRAIYAKERNERFLHAEKIVGSDPGLVERYLSVNCPVLKPEMWYAYYVEWQEAGGTPAAYMTPGKETLISLDLENDLCKETRSAMQATGGYKRGSAAVHLEEKYGVYSKAGWTKALDRMTARERPARKTRTTAIHKQHKVSTSIPNQQRYAPSQAAEAASGPSEAATAPRIGILAPSTKAAAQPAGCFDAKHPESNRPEVLDHIFTQTQKQKTYLGQGIFQYCVGLNDDYQTKSAKFWSDRYTDWLHKTGFFEEYFRSK